jgi:hypothetical protein
MVSERIGAYAPPQPTLWYDGGPVLVMLDGEWHDVLFCAVRANGLLQAPDWKGLLA